MITQLKIGFSNDTVLNYNMSSLMQGIIMENVSPEFAEKEHISETRSYSQYLTKQDGSWTWVINTLTDEAKENIIDRISGIEKFYIKNKDMYLSAESTEIKTTNFDELFEGNYYLDEKQPRYVRIDFITPTAFKSSGSYINYPTVKLLLASMINKYNALSDVTEFGDSDLAEKLAKCVDISNYNLRSTVFHLEGVKIPSFLGHVTLRVNGSKNMISTINMLTEFAQYSGIGIKSAIGMGAVIKNNERRERT
ncbi:MAG: CRISPR-associated endoribonuclease Cas6 [Firmicutes bacterium]|nr:CRISPR-associated endoribonuclease Cas6 [Bacillota bacterium]